MRSRKTGPLVRLDRQIDMLEQEWAADAEVDALQLDKGHPPIVAGAAGFPAHRSVWGSLGKAGGKQNGPHKAARFACSVATPAYFSFASLRSASARSVFSHENAVKALPSGPFI